MFIEDTDALEGKFVALEELLLRFGDVRLVWLVIDKRDEGRDEIRPLTGVDGVEGADGTLHFGVEEGIDDKGWNIKFSATISLQILN